MSEQNPPPASPFGSFEGKRVAVIGAGNGVGKATALGLAALGAKIACLDRDEDGARAVAMQVDELSAGAAFVCDLAEPDTVVRAVTDAAQWAGGLDVLANVAATALVGRATEIEVDAFKRVLDINVVGPFAACRTALPHLIESRGCIINVASLSGIKGMPFGSPYSASKGGLIMLTKSLAVEFAEQGVRVNAIAPGGIATDMKPAGAYPDGGKDVLFSRFRTPYGVAAPQEVADLIIYLVSDSARMVTGTVIPLDGGASA